MIQASTAPISVPSKEPNEMCPSTTLDGSLAPFALNPGSFLKTTRNACTSASFGVYFKLIRLDFERE